MTKDNSLRRTKIVVTLGPVSSSEDVLRKLILAGMDVARLNFSHGSYADHGAVIGHLRTLSAELGKSVTILQDLQGPKIRVGKLPEEKILLEEGSLIRLVPEKEYTGSGEEVPIDYPYTAEEARPGMQVLLDDGLLEMQVEKIEGTIVICRVVEGGILKQRKGVNFPNLNLRLPSLTDKDRHDLEFGLVQEVDWVSLSFVRSAADIKELKKLIERHGVVKPVIAKIEKPQAIDHLEEIIAEANGIMVARGDLGVEMSPEKVPLLQKRIIELCNRAGKPVITATQMLESMIHEPRPTRAEASDVANAIIDGTDCIMLSGETAAGEFPVKAVEMMDKIAREVEARIAFKTYPPEGHLDIMALSEATNIIDRVIKPKCIAVLTASGRSARYVAAERPTTPIYALTQSLQVYHGLNLLWGIEPVLISGSPTSFEDLLKLAENTLRSRNLVSTGDRVIVLGGIPAGHAGGTNFIKIHIIGTF
ncbi:MAG: pyruvate kinase [bacterium]